jgi:peptidoglycan/LPS O-acetylase OafA/YrhL
MWSLANEFWYYISFPLAAWVGLARLTALVRIAALCILFVIITVLPMWLLVYGVIWAAGAAAAWCMRRPALAAFLRHSATRIGTVSLLFAALFLTKVEVGLTRVDIVDLELGIAVAFALPVLATLPSPGGLYRVLARASSELSYTLYLTHFPLLTMIVMVGLAPERLPPSTFAAGLYVALLSVAILWAAAVWWCFERNTDRTYSLIASTLLASRPFFNCE